MEQEFLTISQLAELTGESQATWRKRVFVRSIPIVKCDRNVRVRRGDFERWVTERLVPAGEQEVRR